LKKKLKKKFKKSSKKSSKKIVKFFYLKLQIVGGREGGREGRGGWRIVIPMPEAINEVDGRAAGKNQGATNYARNYVG
jgi:hypothetical protein